MTLTRRTVLAGLLAAPAAGRMAGAQTAVGPQPIAVNLAAVTDWSTQQPFIDMFKTARRWFGDLPGRWGGRDFAAIEGAGLLDADGWPTRVPGDLDAIGTVILTDLPEDARASAGRYRLRFDETGTIGMSGRATDVSYGDGEVSFDFTPGPGPVAIRILRSDPDDTGDHVRNITVVRNDLVPEFEGGGIFQPDFLAMLRGFDVLRFMDWMNTNDSPAQNWDRRARPDDFSYTRHGVPLEIMIALAQQTGPDAWLTLPHLAGDDYMRAMAEVALDLIQPQEQLYVEFSNEVWNMQFAQAKWADAQARALWGIKDRGAQFHGLRASQVARIWSDVFAADGARAQLVNVVATQTGWLGLEADILTAPLAVADGFAPPADAFDAYAITGYFGYALGTDQRRALIDEWLSDSSAAARVTGLTAGLERAALDAHIAAHRYDLASARAGEELRSGAYSGDNSDTLADLAGRMWPYHAEVAARHGLDLIMYEGGTHVTGLGAQQDDDALADFFIHLNYTPQMGALYTDLLDSWAALEAGPFNIYYDVGAPSKWGSWGTRRWPGDDNPRWRAIEARL
ncbi:hypothetical protein [Roseovarius sp. M141]|uniref:hypothetical protein n=1 Tax=Roseovarius sp. M141 TaxID=2583806 RepID=UPI0020CEE076|nr:hypothetical protein [Roseovarius sp. M141]MCQ0092940.1 hypothetical protein [Roseovarius sp. M141]